jgi:hypothetical protein
MDMDMMSEGASVVAGPSRFSSLVIPSYTCRSWETQALQHVPILSGRDFGKCSREHHASPTVANMRLPDISYGILQCRCLPLNLERVCCFY